ncbi:MULTISPECIES: hypothetical protein [Calothrix]|uniref:Uncharacterized protein n=2 Tax=Calothrix TaxID=1186 RepID=A0ABR8A757_9CYAN|nr:MULTISPECIES: hypothetical protein [Calothrix]MBD2195830.1 hypothetical protein [Calothrix parietina FACHB-288]MBD2226421.1 hypothetical protein [Calothrix anomala FACHB-343]
MQFQIECNSEKSSQVCLICRQTFQMLAARLIVCNDDGDGYGEICHQCTAKGGNWVQGQLQEFKHNIVLA